MRIQAGLLVLAISAATSDASAWAAESYETIVIAPPSRAAGEADVATEDLRRVPGAQGDAGKGLENLPGVARPGLGGSELVVWGAAPGETRIVVDGIEIPALYHLGGLRSVVPSSFVRTLSLVPGGYDAEFGRGIGGLVRIDTRAPPAEGYQGEVDVDVLDASFAAGTAVGNGGGVVVAGRVGYLDQILGSALTPETRRLFPLPRYRDFQAKAVYPLREDERIEALFLTSSDASTISGSSTSPLSFAEQGQNQSFTRLGLRYVRALSDGSAASLTPFVGWDAAERRQVAGLGRADELVRSTVLGIRGGYVAPLSPRSTLVVGFDGIVTLAHVERFGPATLPAREGDVVAFGQPMSGGANRDVWSASLGNLAPYAKLEIARGSFRLVPSFRLDGDLVATNRATPNTGITPQVGTSRLYWSPAPRVVLAHQTRSWLQENATIGLYQQAPSPSDLSAVFGSPTLGISHAVHGAVGTEMGADPRFTLQPTLFYRSMWRLVMRNANPSPALAQAFVQDGVGRAYGAQLLVRFAPHPALFGWLAYTLSRSERRHTSESAYRLFDQDQTHLLTIVGNGLWRGFGVGARFRLASGMPRTPVVGAYLDATTGLYQPIFGQQNTIRLPVFYALDLRFERRFRRRSLETVPYLEILNLTNHANVEEFAYDEQFVSRSNITGLPILAVAGVAIRF